MNRAIRVMVVDDERLVIEGISLTIRRDLHPGFELCGSASNGKEAITAIADLSPDIVLLDVSMPGISGLDAMRATSTRGGRPLFILVTAYERFDIVREALRMGAFDYLLKPVKKDTLLAALRDASEELARREASERTAIECRELSESTRSLAAQALLRGLALQEADGEERDAQLSAMKARRYRWMAVAAAFLPTPGSPMPEAEVEALRLAWTRSLRFRTRALTGPAPRGGGIALLPLEDDGKSAKEEIRAAVRASLGADMDGGRLRMGFGAPRPAAELLKSWEEALDDLRGGAKPVRSREEDAEAYFAGVEEALRALSGSKEEAMLGFDALIASQATSPARLAAVLGAAAMRLQERGMLGQGEALSLVDSLHGLFSHAPGAAADRARDILEGVLGAVEIRAQWSLPVARAMAFIKESYGRQIGLEQAAQKAGVSAGRLSRLLSEETGRGFSEILIDTRIERAKELLSRANASVKDVAIAVGYPDSSYFARLFRKVTGRSPSAWAEESQARRDADA